MLRFVFILISAFLGLFGITAAIIALVLHLCRLRSFGMPYMRPFAQLQLSDQKDILVRMPKKMLISRPDTFHNIFAFSGTNCSIDLPLVLTTIKE
ncbi:spore germination protein [Bacillus salipaludis]|uniref:spore germination protein n=1 Tax=Bacillus salipaludis TaxID=2547811 RepID=UPI002E22919C|nr:spore germination protein [Bacillus salipaludis]